jgi:hypothetical protein
MITCQLLRKRAQPSKTVALNTAKVTIWKILQTPYIMLYILEWRYSRFSLTYHVSPHRILFLYMYEFFISYLSFQNKSPGH